MPNLPRDGSALHVTLWRLTGSQWESDEFVYQAAGSGVTQPVLSGPASC